MNRYNDFGHSIRLLVNKLLCFYCAKRKTRLERNLIDKTANLRFPGGLRKIYCPTVSKYQTRQFEIKLQAIRPLN